MGQLNDIFENEDFFSEPRQFLYCFVIDTSGSMKLGRIQKVNQALNKFIVDLQNNIDAKGKVQLCVITCGATEAKIIQPYTSIVNVNPIELVATGGTHICDGASLAIEATKERYQEIKNGSGNVNHPELFIMSDGETDPDDKRKIELVSNQVKEYYKKHITCYYMGIRGEEHDLQMFSPNNKVEMSDEIDVYEVFDRASKSVASASMETALMNEF